MPWADGADMVLMDTGAAIEIAGALDPAIEHLFWRLNYGRRPYSTPDMSYEEYGSAYQFSWESRDHHSDKTFDHSDPYLARVWALNRGTSTLDWQHAKPAVRDSWKHVGNRKPIAAKK